MNTAKKKINVVSFRYSRREKVYLIKDSDGYEAMYQPHRFSEAVDYISRSYKNRRVSFDSHVAGRLLRSLDFERIKEYDNVCSND